MDKSEIYIKMCDCLEIQELEFNHRPNFHFAYYLHERWQIEHEFLGGEKPPIWLPRQDQIQERLGSNFNVLVLDFFSFCTDAIYKRKVPSVKKGKDVIIDEYPMHSLTSMEQLWLAFYMHEKHYKIWDGDKWMKRK